MPFRSRADSFSLYGRRRARFSPPRWLVLLLGGFAAGAAALWFVQERHLPPRLSMEASTQLRDRASRAEAERVRLAAELAQAREQLEAAVQQRRGLARQLEVQGATLNRLHGDLAAAVNALPPDPRNGAVEVRAARFAASGGLLDYQLVLTRARAGGSSAPVAGLVQMVVNGASPQRGTDEVALKPIQVSMGPHEVLRGQVELPSGFRPAQTTVRVLDAKAGTLLGMRMLVVQ
jgi:hypothetical protein